MLTWTLASAHASVGWAKGARRADGTSISPFRALFSRITGTEALDIPLMEARTAKKVCIITITGDRGLCGGYNSKAIQMTEKRIGELKEQGVEVELITVGNKGR
tara:strand:- start:187 stop:498 length:312 start_codon:yes stop_codon:yes gene_type:complete